MMVLSIVRWSPLTLQQGCLAPAPFTDQGPKLVSAKVKHAEEIIDGRHINRHVSIVFERTRIGQIVPAASGQGLKAPVALDEFNEGGMVGISVHDMAAPGMWRDHDERNARPISEEIE